jgi:hypothetical protein
MMHDAADQASSLGRSAVMAALLVYASGVYRGFGWIILAASA